MGVEGWAHARDVFYSEGGRIGTLVDYGTYEDTYKCDFAGGENDIGVWAGAEAGGGGTEGAGEF
jgi:hypothetical protein